MIIGILAGGKGTRLGHITSDIPKPLVEVNSVPFIAILLNYWVIKGATEFVISIGYLGHKISDHLGYSYGGIPISYVDEGEPKGTAFAFRSLCNFIGSPFVLVNGDTFVDVDVEKLMEAESELTVGCCYRIPNSRFGLIECDEKFQVLSIRSKTKRISTNPQLTSTGVLAVNSLKWTPEFDEPSDGKIDEKIILSAAKKGRKIIAAVVADEFFDVGTLEDYNSAPKEITRMMKRATNKWTF